MAVLCCAGLLAGCAGNAGRIVAAEAANPTSGGRPAEVRLALPFHPQKGFACGAASMATMLSAAGTEVTPPDLSGRFYGEDGDPRPILMDIARGYGRLAYPVTGTDALEAELAAGHPVLVVENLGVAAKPLWNCAVAVGYRDGGTRVLLDDDAEARPMNRRVLERLWAETEEWGLVVLRPGDLPATAREADMVEASRGLERSGRLWEAVLSYDTVLGRWPHSADALMGLGATLYLLGDAHGAADAYRAAAVEAKDPAAALAALDRVLSEIGRISGGAAGPARHVHAIAAPGPQVR